MNARPPNEGPPDELDDLYRSAAALDPSRPSDSTRRSILDHAAHLTAQRGAVRRASKRTWRPAIIGTLAAALLAGLVVVPRLWNPPARRQSDLIVTSAPAPAPPPRLAEVRPTDRRAADASAAVSPSLGQSREQARSAAALAAPQMSSRRMVVDSAAALRRAAQAGDIPALNQALRQPADVDAQDESGRTALMLAILNGQGGAVDALLAHGADPNAADAAGTTPLAAALNRADASIADALRRAGARPTQ